MSETSVDPTAPISPASAVDVEGVRPAPAALSGMLDVPLRLTVELGRAELPLAQVLALKPGSVVELDRFPGEPLDLYANGRLLARGEIIVLNDIFGFRITEVRTGSDSASGGLGHD